MRIKILRTLPKLCDSELKVRGEKAEAVMVRRLVLLALLFQNQGTTSSQEISNFSAIKMATDDTVDDTTIELEAEEAKFDLYDEGDTKWIKKAVVEVAYYLRMHKFNDYDRRLVNF